MTIGSPPISYLPLPLSPRSTPPISLQTRYKKTKQSPHIKAGQNNPVGGKNEQAEEAKNLSGL